MPTFHGTIAGDHGTLVFADATLVVGKRKRVERATPMQHLVLRTDDGLEVHIEGIVAAPKTGKITLSGPYGELARHPIAQLFVRSAPGDHVHASIVGFALFAGDRVTVEGEVVQERVARAAGEEGGLREAPARVPSIVRATRITLGAISDDGGVGARRAPDPSPRGRLASAPRVHHPLETSTRVYAAIGAPLVVGALVGGWTLPLVPARAWLTTALCVGLPCLQVSVNRFLRARTHASYVTQVGGPRVTAREPTWGYEIDWAPICAYATWAAVVAFELSPSIAMVTTAVPAVLGLLHAALAAWNDRAFRAFAATMLRAPQGDPASGRMLLLEGRVARPDVALRRRIDFFVRTEVSYDTDPSGRTTEHTHKVWRDREHTSGQTFDVTLPDGRSVRVSPHGARVAFFGRTWEPTNGPARYEETLAVGQPVCVLGRATDDDGTMHVAAGGEESLFLWAGSRAQLVRAYLRAHLAIVASLLLACVPLLLATTAFPFAARYRATGTVSSSTSTRARTGDRCTARLLAYHVGDEPRCSVRLACGDDDLYGGFGVGQTACRFPPSPFDLAVSADDDLWSDGDPAIHVSFDRREIVWTDGASRIAITINDAFPSLTW
ncbi:MAG: hypothetical protein OHK0013_00940 [Sandaracinaceae bacterium]